MAFLTRWKNRLTGGWADVDVEVSPAPAQLGADVTVTMTVVVKNVPIDVDGTIIEIRGGRERTVVTADPDGGTYEKFDVLYSDQVKTAGAQQLAAASTQTFTATLPLPADAPHSSARVDWQVQAILVMACVGHNPNSGWSHFSVRA